MVENLCCKIDATHFAHGSIEVKKLATIFENIIGIIATHKAMQAMKMNSDRNLAANSFPTS